MQPHLAPPPTRSSVRLSHDPSVIQHDSLSCYQSVRPPTNPPVCLSPCKSVALSVHPTDSPSIIPTHPSSAQSVHPPVTPSMTRQSATPPVSPEKRQSDRLSPSDHLSTILPRLSSCPTLSDHTSTIYTSPSNHPSLSDRLHTILPRPSDHPPPSHRLYNAPSSPSACPSPTVCLTSTTTRPPVRLSFPMIHHSHDSIHSLAVMNGEQSHTIHRTQDSSQSLAVVNGEQSCKAKKFHRAFTNYDLLLHALDASNIYLRDFRHVAPPKSGEDAHVTRGKCDFGGATQNNPSLVLATCYQGYGTLGETVHHLMSLEIDLEH